MTLDDLAYHHRLQAEYFAPFGASNALTKFHYEAAACCVAAAKACNANAEILTTATRGASSEEDET